MTQQKLLLTMFVTAAVYCGSYAWFRQTHVEIWSKNNRPYVIFPKGNRALYYAFRPMSYLDGKITGMGFHIGPHQ
jgi:hypothetical protein